MGGRSRRFGQSRYGHVFSSGKGFGANRGCDPVLPTWVINMDMSLKPEKKERPVAPVETKTFPPETALTTFGDLARHRQALHYGCLRCVGTPRQISPHEAAVRFGMDMRIVEVRTLLQSRCTRRKGQSCELQMSPSTAPWEPYRVRP